MAEANVFFLYDIDTEELLGFAAFEGTLKEGCLSEDERSYVMKVDNYRFFSYDGSIIPTIKNGIIHVGIYEILNKWNGTDAGIEVIPLPQGPHPKFFAELMIPRFAEQARLKRDKFKEQQEMRVKQQTEIQAKQQTKQSVAQMFLVMVTSSTKKWNS